MCLCVCEKGPGLVISQIYYSGSAVLAGRRGLCRMGRDVKKLSLVLSLRPYCMCEDVCACFTGQHLAHSPQTMATPGDVMVLISRASVVGFGVSVWRERARGENRMRLMGLGGEW